LKACTSQSGQVILPVTKSSVWLSFLSDPSSGSYPEAVKSSPYSPTKAFFAWFQCSASKQMRSVLFWFITQRVVVVSYWRFGTNFRSHLLESRDSWALKMGPIVCPVISVWNYHYSLR